MSRRSYNNASGNLGVSAEFRKTLWLLKILLKDLKAYLFGLAGVIAGVTAVWSGFAGVEDRLMRIWLTVGAVVAPLVTVFIVYTLPRLAEAARISRLKDTTVSKRSDIFQLTLWGGDGYTFFKRADGKHIEVYDWVAKNTKSGGAAILFVDGLSGTGKSSLMVNYVAKRAAAELDCGVADIRASMNPVREMTNALSEYWTNLPVESSEWSLSSWFERAEKRKGAPGKFVLFIDQGEELLGLKGSEEEDHPLIDFLKDHVANPIEWLLVVVGTRTEYIGKFEDLNFLKNGVYRKSVSAFDEGAAQEFMRKGLENEVDALQLARAGSLLDGLAGLIRPITLNMLGMIYRKDEALRSALSAVRADRVNVFVNYLKQRVQANDLRETGPAVMRELVTMAGRREPPKSLSQIRKTLRCDEEALRKCLEIFASEGIVRSVNNEWELAHDFLAAPMNSVLQRWENRFWQTARAFVMPSFIVLWVVIISILALDRYMFLPLRNQEEVRKLDIELSKSIDEKWALRFAEGWCGDLSFVTQKLRHLWPEITEVVLVNANISEVASLGGMVSLEKLVLRECDKLQNVIGLKNFKYLYTLDLSGCNNLENVSGLNGLASLQYLDLRDCNELRELDGLEELKDLMTLYLSGCTKLQDVDDLKDLNNLEWLNLSCCASLENVDGLNRLKSLQYLNLSHCNKLRNFDGPKGLKDLRELDMSNCDNLQNVDGLRGMTSLTKLDLSSCRNLQNVKSLIYLTSVQYLDLSHCSKLRDLGALKGLRDLRELDMSNCDDLQNVDGLRGMTSLTKLDLSNCRNLRNVKSLMDLTSLRILQIWSTGVDKAMINTLRITLPNCKIITNPHR